MAGDDDGEFRTGVRLSDELGESGIRVWHLAAATGVLLAIIGAVAWLSGQGPQPEPAYVRPPDCSSDDDCSNGFCARGECVRVRTDEEIEEALQRSPQPRKKARGSASGYEPGSAEWRRCQADKRRYIDRCSPECQATGAVGERFDECLAACTRREFGADLPTCTRAAR